MFDSPPGGTEMEMKEKTEELRKKLSEMLAAAETDAAVEAIRVSFLGRRAR